MSKAEGVWHLCTNGGCVIDWMDHWQTMITGVGAVVAAMLALRASNAQARSARLGRLRSARAILPAELSNILSYAERVGIALDRKWPSAAVLYTQEWNEDDEFSFSYEGSDLPDSVVRALERVVENTTDKHVAERVESILREAQVLAARLRPTGDESINLAVLASYIVQAAALHARAASLMPYARQHSQSVDGEPLWNRTFEALALMQISREAVLAYARKEKDLGLPPGEADTIMA